MYLVTVNASGYLEARVSVNVNDFIESIDVALIPLGLPEIAGALFDGFAEADQNADGQLSFDEARTILEMLTQAQFDELDRDRDGFLLASELMAIIPTTDGCFRCPGSESKGLGKVFGELLLLGAAMHYLLRWEWHRV